MKRIFMQNHKSISFRFRQNKDDFVVDEIPLFDAPSDKGNYLITKVQKHDLSTMELLDLLEHELNCYNIGYAGLKDKHATTTQYISMPLSFAKAFNKFRHPRIKVLENFRSKEKLNIGDLKGNHFKIRLHEVSAQSAQELVLVLDDIMRHGMPNYFGYQRFGKDSANFDKAKEVAQGERLMKDKKIHKIMLHAYQSYLFNDWLADRVRLSKQINTHACEELLVNHNISEQECALLKNQVGLLSLLPGDIIFNKMTKKFENVSDIQKIRKPYKEQKVVPTGLLVGSKAWRAKGLAGNFEQAFDDVSVVSLGRRREAIVYPKAIRHKYDEETRTFEVSFRLDKGAYATVLLENLANKDLTPKSSK